MNNCYKCEVANGKCSDCAQRAVKVAKLAPAVKAFVDYIQAPSGFTKTSGRGHHNGIELWSSECSTWVLLENVEAGIRIAINIADEPSSRYKKGKKIPCRNTMEDLSCNGHTCYKTDTGWKTFDRRGVGDSFYIGDNVEPVADVSRVIQEQIERIAVAKELTKQMVSIPGFGYSIHKDKLEEVKKKIQRGGSHTFTPSGFGTGHIVSTCQSRYATRMPAETAAFFGVSALYDQTFDHD